jgi:hypothetical protein
MKRQWAISLMVLIGLQAHAADPVRLKIGREIYAAYSSITGVASDQELRDLLKANQDRLPKTGAPEELSNSGVLAATELGGMFCRKALNKETTQSAGSRILFTNVDFNRGPSQFTEFKREALLDHLATLFWQRNITAAEKTSLATMMTKSADSGPDSKEETVNLMQTLCGTYASSLAFLVK